MSNFEIITPNKAEQADPDSVPGPAITQEVDGVESPVELSKTDQMIKTKVEHYFDIKWSEKWKEIFDRWKFYILGAVQTLLLLLAAYMGRIT